MLVQKVCWLDPFNHLSEVTGSWKEENKSNAFSVLGLLHLHDFWVLLDKSSSKDVAYFPLSRYCSFLCVKVWNQWGNWCGYYKCAISVIVIESQNMLIWKGPIRLMESHSWPCVGHPKNHIMCKFGSKLWTDFCKRYSELAEFCLAWRRNRELFYIQTIKLVLNWDNKEKSIVYHLLIQNPEVSDEGSRS